MATTPTLSRRGFLFGAGGAVGGALLAGCGSSSPASSASAAKPARGGALDIYSWPAYFSQSNLSGFKKANGTTVNISTYNSNDALFAKLNATSGGGFDMAIPTSGWIQVLASHGLVQELDHSQIPWGNVDPTLLNLRFDPGNKYSVPKDYGVTGVCYNAKVLKHKIVSWQDFLDAGSQPGVSGHIDIGAGAEEILGIALFAADRDWNTDNLTYINEAGATMKEFAKHVKEFNGFDTTGLVNGSIVMAMTDQSFGRQAMEQNHDLRYVVPTPTAELWVDNYTIVKDAHDPGQAYSFIKWQLQPAHQVADSVGIGYPTVMPGLTGKLPAAMPLKNVMIPDKATLERLTTFVVRPKIQQVMTSLYNEISYAAG
jgi:spermidine/putrescine transport system substrate-binding protein